MVDIGKKLSDLCIKRSQDIPMRINGFSRRDLVKLFKEVNFTKGVEVGVDKGRFSEYMCQVNPNLELISIDPYAKDADKKFHELGDKRYAHAKKRLEKYNCRLIRDVSMNAVRNFKDSSLDFVYIDGSHEFDFVMQDIIEWNKKVRVGGIVAGHDYELYRQGNVVAAVNVYTKQHKITKWFLTEDKFPSWFWIKEK
jgi:hypothetical protein